MASGSFTGVGVSPQVSFATNTAEGLHLIVGFSEPMTKDSALTTPGNYTITALSTETAYQPTSVIVPSDTYPRGVLLELQGRLLAGTDNFRLTVANTLTDVAGNTLDAAADTADFSGVGVTTDSVSSSSLETALVSTWAIDSTIPYLVSLRRTLADVTVSNGKQVLAYAYDSPYRNFISDSHRDVALFDYEDVVNRVSATTAANAVARHRGFKERIFLDAKTAGVSTNLVDTLLRLCQGIPAEDTVTFLRMMAALVVLAAAETL